MFKNEGVPKIQQLVTSVDKEPETFMSEMKREIYAKHRGLLRNLEIAIRTSTLSRDNLQEVEHCILLMDLLGIPQPPVEVQIRTKAKIAQNIGALSDFLNHDRNIAIDRTAQQLLYAHYLLHVYGIDGFKMQDKDWEIIDQVIRSSPGYSIEQRARIAFVRYLVHPEHKVPSDEFLGEVAAYLQQSTEVFPGAYTVLKLFRPQALQYIDDSGWSLILSSELASGAANSPYSVENLGYCLLAAAPKIEIKDGRVSIVDSRPEQAHANREVPIPRQI